MLACTGAPQNAAHPGQELAQVEGFGKVIIGSHFKSHHPVNDFPFAGQDDDSNIGVLPQIPGQGKSILAGKHEIENDQIHRSRCHNPAHRLAVFRSADPEAFPRKVVFHQFADRRFVVHHQDMFFCRHG